MPTWLAIQSTCAFTRSRKLPLQRWWPACAGFVGAAACTSEVDSFFDHMGTGLSVLRQPSDRVLAKARAKLHVPALWGLNAKLMQNMQNMQNMQGQGLVALWKGRRLVCADATLLAPAQCACHRTHRLPASSQRAVGLYSPCNAVMLHMAVGPESEGERQML